jgi:hypothetical protein
VNKDSLRSLLEAIAKKDTLTRLDISENWISDEGATLLVGGYTLLEIFNSVFLVVF